MLFHASSIGRTDVVQNAIGSLRSSGASEQELLSLISMGRPEDDATPLHLAAAAGHSDVIRYLLVCETNLHWLQSKKLSFHAMFISILLKNSFSFLHVTQSCNCRIPAPI